MGIHKKSKGLLDVIIHEELSCVKSLCQAYSASFLCLEGLLNMLEE